MLRVTGSYTITWGVRKRYFDEAVAIWAKTLNAFSEEIHNQIDENQSFTRDLFLGEAAGAIITGVWSALRTWDDITSQTGGVGPMTPWHKSQLGHDFNGHQITPIRDATGRTVRDNPMSVVPRPGMQRRTLQVKGKQVEIWGQAEFSSSTTPGHFRTMVQHVEKMAKTGEYKYFVLQRSWRTATGRTSQERLMPDIIGVRWDDVVDAWEVRSLSDTTEILRARLKVGMQSLPERYRGRWDVLEPGQ
jgi:hypothetical protein